MTMKTYKITGGFNVAGKQPGDTVTEEDLGDANIPVLIEAGCITPIKAAKADPEEQ
jgi:hypothetical protein